MNRHLIIVAGASLALCGLSAYAHDSAAQNTQNPQVNCSKLPVSQRGICGIEHPSQSGTLAASPRVSHQQQQAIDARYARAIAQCKRMPVSERNTCVDDAGLAADREATSRG